jgi:hypothetical protein
MDTIAAVGWNNNMLYRWAWDNLPAASGPVLDVSTPATGIMRGIYAPERGAGRAFRWTMERAQLRFAAPGAERLLLELRAPRPATPVEVFYQGQQVAALQVGTDWQEVAISLPASSAPPDDVQVVELRAPTHVRSTAAPYPRGVALASIRLE